MQNSKNKGWVRLYRQIEDNFLWFSEAFTKAQAWIDLFLNANHKDGIMNIRGNIIPIERGQIGWSELTMARRWKWSKCKVRRFLKLLEIEQQIIQQKDRYITTIITIIKYDYYQSDTADDTAERQQKDSRRYINKNVKNDKNVKKLSEQGSEGKLINNLISLFKDVNPNYEILFRRLPERQALERLLKKHGQEKVENTINALQGIITQKFAPRITTPIQLENRLGDLIAFYKQEKNKVESKKLTLIQ